MKCRVVPRSVGLSEFLCLCVALTEDDLREEAWKELQRISAPDAERVLEDLERFETSVPCAMENATLFLKSKVWK